MLDENFQSNQLKTASTYFLHTGWGWAKATSDLDQGGWQGATSFLSARFDLFLHICHIGVVRVKNITRMLVISFIIVIDTVYRYIVCTFWSVLSRLYILAGFSEKLFFFIYSDWYCLFKGFDTNNDRRGKRRAADHQKGWTWGWRWIDYFENQLNFSIHLIANHNNV